jgi:hypothetical protein
MGFGILDYPLAAAHMKNRQSLSCCPGKGQIQAVKTRRVMQGMKRFLNFRRATPAFCENHFDPTGRSFRHP